MSENTKKKSSPKKEEQKVKIEELETKITQLEETTTQLEETIAKDKAEKVVRDIIESNFKRIQAEVKGIIDRECRQPQDIRMVDPFV